jgi:hypothetical protein
MSLHKDYTPNLKMAGEFEDFVSDVFYWRFGTPVHVYRSRKFQVAVGESRAGVEVKLDLLWRQTGRLFIETAERWNEQVEMRPAGIHGPGWLYVVGDFSRFWVFGTRTLRLLESEGSFVKKEIATARGFVLPVANADRWASRIFELGGEGDRMLRAEWFADWRKRLAENPAFVLEHDRAWWDEWERCFREVDLP